MRWRYLALSAYFANLGLLVAWYGWLAPSQILPRAIVLLILVLPMLAPLRGLLHGRPYTYAWSCFLALLYFSHGVVEAYSNSAARHLALLEIQFCVFWFVAGIAFVRAARRPVDGET